MSLITKELKLNQPRTETATVPTREPRVDRLKGVIAGGIGTPGVAFALMIAARMPLDPNPASALVGAVWMLLALGLCAVFGLIVAARGPLPKRLTGALMGIVGVLALGAGLRAGCVLFGRVMPLHWLELVFATSCSPRACSWCCRSCVTN